MSYSAVMARPAKSERVAARLTVEAKHILEALAVRLGVSESSLIEMSIREFAERRGLIAPPSVLNERRDPYQASGQPAPAHPPADPTGPAEPGG